MSLKVRTIGLLRLHSSVSTFPITVLVALGLTFSSLPSHAGIKEWKERREQKAIEEAEKAEKLRRRIVRERRYTELVKGFSKRLKRRGTLFFWAALLGSGAVAAYLCERGSLGCKGKAPPPPPPSSSS